MFSSLAMRSSRILVFTSAMALERWAARSRAKSSLRICSVFMPCAARARRPRRKEPALGVAFHAAALAVGHVLADAGFQVGKALIGAEFFGKVVVQLGQGPLLDGLHFHVVGHGLAGQF